MTDIQSPTPRKKFFWPFSVDQIFHRHKHLDIDEMIFWFVCDRTVWHRRFIRKRGKDTGDWWTLCSGRIVSRELSISSPYARKRLKFLREIGLLKASGITNDRSYTPVFYDKIRTQYLEDRRWVRKPKPAPDLTPDSSIASVDDIHSIVIETKKQLKETITFRDNTIISKRPDTSESAFRSLP
jgi:hypothetical protein